jgi:hypothetical protein
MKNNSIKRRTLNLDAQTVRRLSSDELGKAAGGLGFTKDYACTAGGGCINTMAFSFCWGVC